MALLFMASINTSPKILVCPELIRFILVAWNLVIYIPYRSHNTLESMIRALMLVSLASCVPAVARKGCAFVSIRSVIRSSGLYL